MNLLEVVGSLALSVCCGLDRTAMLQFMISRPIVASALMGWLWGEPVSGLKVGICLELLWLARLPVGASVPPDDTQMALGAVVIAVMAQRLGPLPMETAVLLGVVVALVGGSVGRSLDHRARKANVGLVSSVRQSFDEGTVPPIERLHLNGLIHFSLSSLLTFGFIVLLGGVFLLVASAQIAMVLDPIAPLGLCLIPLAGVIGLLAQNRSHDLPRFFVAGFGGVWLLWILMK